MGKRNILRVFAFALIITGSFAIGYNNVPVSIFFLNQQALIGLLTICAVFLAMYVAFLKNKLMRAQLRRENDSTENEVLQLKIIDLRRELHAVKQKKRRKK